MKHSHVYVVCRLFKKVLWGFIELVFRNAKNETLVLKRKNNSPAEVVCTNGFVSQSDAEHAWGAGAAGLLRPNMPGVPCDVLDTSQLLNNGRQRRQ
jgi:hypothetical protein